MKKMLIVGILSVLYSCSRLNNQNEFIVKNIDPIDCKVDSVINTKSGLILPMRMIIVDTFLIVYQNLKDSLFSIFSLPDCKHITSMGTTGNGPLEFNVVSVNAFKSIKDSINKGGFSIINRGNKLQFFHISSIIRGDLTPYKTIPLPPGLSRIRAADIRNDSVMFAAPYGGDANLYKYELFKGTATIFQPYPKVYPQLDRNQMRELYGCYLTIKPDNSMLALTYSNQGIIEIINRANKQKMTLRYHGFPQLERNIDLSATSGEVLIHSGYERIFSFGICSTDNFIYVLVYNRVYNEIFKKGDYDESIIPEIHVYKWNGKPVGRLKLDRVFSDFIVDDSDNYLYAIDENIENKIYRYRITYLQIDKIIK